MRQISVLDAENFALAFPALINSIADAAAQSFEKSYVDVFSTFLGYFTDENTNRFEALQTQALCEAAR